ncbi:hypothetical protein [Pseudomonas sp. KCJK8993]|uniref:hypothetical protein n=1 Tax=Pseudomonas sp. KCJK8993 TaxID=3344565 RepID=UPI003905E713
MQPIFTGKKPQLVRNKIPLHKVGSRSGAFASEKDFPCSQKEQKRQQPLIYRQGATDSRQIGCTLFILLHRIRAQGATVFATGASAGGFPGETSVINARHA